MSSSTSALKLTLSKSTWNPSNSKLPRGMLQYHHETTVRELGRTCHRTIKSQPLFPEFGTPLDATLYFQRLFHESGLLMSIDGRDWWVTYNPEELWVIFNPAHGAPLPPMPSLRRRRWAEDPGRLELDGPQPPLVLFGQPRQAKQRIFAHKGSAARNLFTLCSPQFTESVLLVTDGWGKPSAAFLDRNNL